MRYNWLQVVLPVVLSIFPLAAAHSIEDANLIKFLNTCREVVLVEDFDHHTGKINKARSLVNPGGVINENVIPVLSIEQSLRFFAAYSNGRDLNGKIIVLGAGISVEQGPYKTFAKQVVRESSGEYAINTGAGYVKTNLAELEKYFSDK